MSKKNEKTACYNCTFFDNSKHVTDKRTKHAGLCKKWSEITFQNDSCKYWLNVDTDKTWNDLIAPRLHDNQTQLF
jgi:hypothetical protein